MKCFTALTLLFLASLQMSMAQKEEFIKYHEVAFLKAGGEEQDYVLELLKTELRIFTGNEGNELFLQMEGIEPYHFTIISDVGKNYVNNSLYYQFVAWTSESLVCNFRFFPNENDGLYVSYPDGVTIQYFNSHKFNLLEDLRDGKTYNTIKIGNQVWMAENLAYKPTSGNYWAYDNNSSNIAKYGYLYDWETACKVCPSGWHLPSDAEWNRLTAYLGGESVAGTKMKSTRGWGDNGNGSGTNVTGFSGLPGGGRFPDPLGAFYMVGGMGYWWSSSEIDIGVAWKHDLVHNNGNVNRTDTPKGFGFSVRCIMDSSEKDNLLEDLRDGKTYNTIKIGNQVWMAENLAYKPTSGNYFAYDNNSSNIAKYGYLYDWKTACKVCPSGWHLPSDVEWTRLTDYLGGENIAGTKMKSSSGWRDNGSGTNESGFSGLPGGFRDKDGTFRFIGEFGFWWSSSENDSLNAWFRNLFYDYGDGYRSSYSKGGGFSVRCLRD